MIKTSNSKSDFMDEVFTFEETAKYLKISRSKLYSLVQQRKIPASKIGRTWRFKKIRLDEWLDQEIPLKTNTTPEVSISLISLSLAGLSLRTKIKLYQKRAHEIKSYLSQHPREWSRFQREFNLEMDNIFRDILDFEKSNGAESQKVKKFKKFFIKKFRPVFMNGIYGPWSITKPLGYPGDYKIIDDIYQNSPPTLGFDRLFDNYFMMSAISTAVRNRKEDFKRLLLDFINNNDQRVRIMDLASGPCRELKEILESGQARNKNVIFDCYDHEKKAIDFAKSTLDKFKNVNFIKENVLRLFIVNNITMNIKEKYDFIYSTGFFDYLSHRICVRVIKNLRKVLNDNGVLAVSNVRDKYSNPSMHYMEWAGDWNLVYRTDEEFKKIFLEAGFLEEELVFQYERQKILQYIIAKKSRSTYPKKSIV